MSNEEYIMSEAVDGEDAAEALASVNFNVEDEYKEPSLIPKSVYHAAVVAVKFQPAKFSLLWEFVLQNNGGVMSDGSTPIDGARVYYNNWLPKPGDENVPIKSGTMSKRQFKINALKEFQDNMGIDMSTPQIIAQALAEAQWIGIEVDVDVDISEYQGRFRNEVNRIRPIS
jgi:hypothetical protein